MNDRNAMLKQRLPYMDFLKGIAILYIVGVRHLDDYAGGFYHNKIDDVITYSLLGMFVFISGYLLSVNNSINTKSDIIIFIKKRFLRIYPLYILTLLLFFLFSMVSLEELVEHIFLINILLNKSILTLWFVSLICVFYIIFPILLFKYNIYKISLYFIAISLIVLMSRKYFGLFDMRILTYIPLFIFGIISFKQNLLEKYINSKLILFISIIIFISCVFLHFNFTNDDKQARNFFMIMFMIASIQPLLLFGKFCIRFVPESIFINIAYASFCMYLLHRIIFHLMIILYNPNNDILTICYLTSIGMPVIYFTSFYIQKKYDSLTKRFTMSS